jgi:hypothetical protein
MLLNCNLIDNDKTMRIYEMISKLYNNLKLNLNLNILSFVPFINELVLTN